MAYKPEGVLTGGGGANHMLLRCAGGAEWGTRVWCPGPPLVGPGASGLVEAGGEACTAIATFKPVVNLPPHLWFMYLNTLFGHLDACL